MNTATRIKVLAGWAIACRRYGRRSADRREARTGRAGQCQPRAGVGKPAQPLWPAIDFVFWGQVLTWSRLGGVVIASVLVWVIRRASGDPDDPGLWWDDQQLGDRAGLWQV